MCVRRFRSPCVLWVLSPPSVRLRRGGYLALWLRDGLCAGCVDRSSARRWATGLAASCCARSCRRQGGGTAGRSSSTASGGAGAANAFAISGCCRSKDRYASSSRPASFGGTAASRVAFVSRSVGNSCYISAGRAAGICCCSTGSPRRCQSAESDTSRARSRRGSPPRTSIRRNRRQ